jgi:transposase
MIYVHLTETQRDELSAVSRQAIGRVALRAHLVLLSDRGFTVSQIAAIHACGEDVVRIWLHRYEQQGVAGLEDEPRSGRPPKDPLAAPIVDAQASQSPPCSGHVQSGLPVALLAAYLSQRFRLVLSCASVRRALHQMGWRWARPRLAPARKPDPEAQAKRAALAQAHAQARHGLAHLLSLDESDLHLLPLIRSMWMRMPASAHPNPWHQSAARLLWCAECGQRAVVLG